jgi:hypothetical protein
MMYMEKISDDEVLQAIHESKTMSQACSKLSMSFSTFKRRAISLGVYNPNRGGKGTSKPSKRKISTADILDGMYPHYQTFKLKLRLIDEGYLENECLECGISEWNGKFLPLELDHIDGNPTNHDIKNLRMLCPNCHSQTETFRAKNKRKK